VKSLLDELFSTLFPRPCPLCRTVILEDQEGFCPSCLEGFHFVQDPVCARCGYPLSFHGEGESSLCPGCLSRTTPLPPSYAVRSIALYAGNVRNAILRVKHGGQAPVAHGLSVLVRDRFRHLFPLDLFERLLPVPLHPRRLRAREFNQCVLLARPLAARLGIPIDLDSVERVRHTPPQRGSTESERRKNLRGAFRVRKPGRIRHRSILLFDDVYTSGATLEELARTLLSAGASLIAALTLARSPRGIHFMPAEGTCARDIDTKTRLD
jgi:ComF family protein